MTNKYKETISKIKADEEFKNSLIEKLEKKEKRKGVIAMKIRKAIITIITTIGILAGSGVAYAALGGTIQGVPVVEWLGIRLSSNYVEYVQPVENQVVETDGIKVALESTLCDDGYTILQFRVNISDEKLAEYKTEEDVLNGFEVPLCYLSFNDKVQKDENGNNYVFYAGSNYNVIIDGKEEFLRGLTDWDVQYINSDKEMMVYQYYFLDDKILGDKTEFELTLKDIAIGLGEDCIPIDGEFNIKLSKNKSLANTTTFGGNNTSINYKKMSMSIDKISSTPIKNIIKLQSIIKDADTESWVNSLDDDYIGEIDYKVFDENGNELSSTFMTTANSIKYKNGKIEEYEPGEMYPEQKFEDAQINLTNYISLDKINEINRVYIEVYAINEYYNKSTYIGKFEVDLSNGKTTAAELDREILTNEMEEETYQGLIDSGEISSIDIGLNSDLSIETLENEGKILTDKDAINKLVSIINDKTKYIKGYEYNGVYLEDFQTQLRINYSNGIDITISVLDGYNHNGNVVNLIAKTSQENHGEPMIYVINDKLEEYVKNIYETY